VTAPGLADTPIPDWAEPVSVRGRLAWTVAAAVDQVSGVRRSGGPGVEVATQYRGGRVLGVGLGETDITVHVVAERLPLEPLIRAVRDATLNALRAASDGRGVTVIVDDLDVQRLPSGLK
jgi:hypothetical protein